jgi:hypothetical protein
VALAFFMHRLRCSLKVRWASNQTPSHLIASLSNLTKPFPTLIFAVSFGCWCCLWPRLQVKCAASVFAVSNSSSHLSTKSMLALAQVSSYLTTSLTLFPIATHLVSSTKDRHPAPETLFLTYLMSCDE